jgi:hypothetical protein
MHLSYIEGRTFRRLILVFATAMAVFVDQAQGAARAEFHVTLEATRVQDGLMVTIKNASNGPVPVSGFRGNGAGKELNLLLRPIPPARFAPQYESAPLVFKGRWPSNLLKPGESRSATLKWSQFDDFDSYASGCYDAEIAYISINDSGNTISNKVSLGKVCREAK